MISLFFISLVEGETEKLLPLADLTWERELGSLSKRKPYFKIIGGHGNKPASLLT